MVKECEGTVAELLTILNNGAVTTWILLVRQHQTSL